MSAPSMTPPASQSGAVEGTRAEATMSTESILASVSPAGSTGHSVSVQGAAGDSAVVSNDDAVSAVIHSDSKQSPLVTPDSNHPGTVIAQKVIMPKSTVTIINPSTITATDGRLQPIRRVVSANVVVKQVDGTIRSTKGRPPLRSTTGSPGRSIGVRTVTAGRRGDQINSSAQTRIKKDRPEVSKVSQTNSISTSTPTNSAPKRRRMASFQHAFLMCGAKAEPVTPQQSKVTLLQSSPLAPSRFRPPPNGPPGASTIIGRPGGPSVIRVSSVGAKKVIPPAVRGYVAARRPPYKQTVPRMTPVERDKLLTTQTSNISPKRGGRSSLKSVLPSIRSNALTRIKQEGSSRPVEYNGQPAEMPDVVARMMQIHAPVSDDGKLPISRPSFLNLQMRRDFATISSNGDVETQEGSASQSTPTLLPTSYTVSMEKTVQGEEGSSEKSHQVKVRVPPLPPALKCGVFVVKHQEKTGIKLQPVPSLRGDAVAWLDPRGPFQKADGSRGTGPYLMYARSEDKDTNRRRFACAHHGCRVTLTADMDTMLVLRRCGAFHRHDNSEADLNKRRIREKLRKRLRLYDGTRTPGEILREFPELFDQDNDERLKEMKKAAINIRRSPIDGDKIPRWGKQLSEVVNIMRTLENLCSCAATGTSVDDSSLKLLESAIGLIPEVQRALPVDAIKLRKPRKKRKKINKGAGRGRGHRGLSEADSVHEEEDEGDGEDEFTADSPDPLEGPEAPDETRPIIDTGNSVAAVREEPHRCGECSQTFWAWANLVRHLRIAHKQPLVDCNSARCIECGVVMRALDSEVETHLDFHGFLGRLRFSSMKDVFVWRTQQECEGGRALVKIRDELKDRSRTMMWVCPRRPDVECRLLECEFCPMATTADPLACSVFIKAIEDLDDGSVDVRYSTKHSSACLQWNLTSTCFLHSVRRHVVSVAESESRPVILCKDVHQMNEVHPSLLRDDFLVVFCDVHQVRLLSRLTEKNSLSIESLTEGIKLTTVALLLNPPTEDLDASFRSHPESSGNGAANNAAGVHQRCHGNPNKLTLVHIISTASDESSLLAAFSELRRYTGRVRARLLVDASGSARSKCGYSVAREAWRRAMGLGNTQLIDPVTLALATAEDCTSTSGQDKSTTLPVATHDSSLTESINCNGVLQATSTVVIDDNDEPSKSVDLSEQVDACAASLQQDPLRRDLDRLRDGDLSASSVLGLELRGPAAADDIQRTLTEACTLLADARASQGVHAHAGSKQLVANGRLALGRLKEAIRLLVEPPIREQETCDGQTLTMSSASRVDEHRLAPQVAVGLAVNHAVSQAVGHSVVATAAPLTVAVANGPVPISNTVVANSVPTSNATNSVATTINQVAVGGPVTVTGQMAINQVPVATHTPTIVPTHTAVGAGSSLQHQVVMGYPTSAGSVQVQVGGTQQWTSTHLIPIHHNAPVQVQTQQQVQMQHRQTYLQH